VKRKNTSRFSSEGDGANMKVILVAIAVYVFGYALSWAITVGIIKLITLCFSLNFSLLPATGIWLILCAIKLIFCKSKKD